MRKVFILTYGGLDLFLILWLSISSILSGEIPIISDITSAYSAAVEFEGGAAFVLFALNIILLPSILFSGILLLRQMKLGALLSLIQTPFRLFLIIPPTLFFITWIGKVFVINNVILLAPIILFELHKAYILIKWMKSK